jgi:threonylcarbamoyladenosine tRNA methylthiotransferase MtaB
VLGEIRRRVGQGHREVVLTGINLGCFRDREARLGLAGLVRAAGAIDGLERLRLSSIEINHVGPELLAALRETPAATRHLHVPLQSGDDTVLAAMGRRYSRATYLRRLEGLAEEFNLTSDVIVGFPGEDERAFARTLETVAAAGLTRVHVFPYSPRPATGTAALDPVPAAVKKERSARLRELSFGLERRRWEGKLGSRELVLVDRPGRGYGGDYTPFLVEAPVGTLLAVRAERLAEDGIVGIAA